MKKNALIVLFAIIGALIGYNYGLTLCTQTLAGAIQCFLNQPNYALGQTYAIYGLIGGAIIGYIVGKKS